MRLYIRLASVAIIAATIVLVALSLASGNGLNRSGNC